MAQHDSASSTPYDLLGVGFGPSNLALAIALREQKARLGRPLQSLFIDRQADYRWHGNTLVTQSELQISFLKDLVTLRNPTSPFSFVNYLHSQGRLVDFTNLGTFYPCRLEFNDYLRWVAEHFADQSRYGEEVVRVEPAPPEADGTIRQLEVVARDAEGSELRYRTRALALSTGGTPRIPQVFRALRQCPQVFHHAQYLERVAALPCAQGEPMRIAVVGGGQSAAEAFIDLNDSYPHVKVDMVLRGAVLKPADDSPFVNEIFAPEYTDLVFNQPPEERERLINEYHNTNYSVVDLDLIERIYGILYRQKVAKSQRHGFLCRRSIEAAHVVGQQVELRLHDVATGAVENHRYDAVILATGYERTSHRQLLEPLAPLLQTFEVDRAYRLQTDQRLQAPIFLQGFCQHSHGLSDTLLSVLPARAGEIAEALHATLESIVPHPPQAALADA